MATVPLILMIENEILLEEHPLRPLHLHVSLKGIPSDLFWKGHENLKINFFFKQDKRNHLEGNQCRQISCNRLFVR